MRRSNPNHDEPENDQLTDRSRRRLLGKGAAAAAGVVAGGILLDTGTAEANNGDNLVIGQANSGSSTTTLSGSRLKAVNGNGGVSLEASHASNNAIGVYAVVDGTNSVGMLGVSPGTSANAIGVKGQGKTGVSGDGNFPGGIGVNGYGPIGVRGQSPANNGTAVSGDASGPNSTGVSGVGTSMGVYGEGEVSGIAAFSNNGDALNAHSDGAGKAAIVAETLGAGGIGVKIDAPLGPALRLGQGPTIPPAAGSWSAGDIVESNGLWCCIAGGIGPASRWVKLSRVYQPLATPVRIYDSRPGYDPAGVQKGKITGGGERVIDATVGGAVPTAVASAVEVNVTVTDTEGTGWLSLFSNAIAWPGTSTINWFLPSMMIANGATVAVDGVAKFKVRSSGTTHFLIDVTGYYT